MLYMHVVYMQACFKKESMAFPWLDSLQNVIPFPPHMLNPSFLKLPQTPPTIPQSHVCDSDPSRPPTKNPLPTSPPHPIPYPSRLLPSLQPSLLATPLTHPNASTPSLFHSISPLASPSIAITCLRSFTNAISNCTSFVPVHGGSSLAEQVQAFWGPGD